MSTIRHPGLPFPLGSKPSICQTKCEEFNLHECRTSIVDVLYALKGKHRDTSAREKWIPKNATACSSRPPNSTVMQQSSSLAQAQSFSQSHTTTFTSTAPSVVPNTTSSTDPHATINTLDSPLTLDLSYLSRVYRRPSLITNPSQRSLLSSDIP